LLLDLATHSRADDTLGDLSNLFRSHAAMAHES
jgi:hypothetical protein